ncbi:12910_t:CDS:2, partial [Cetraspora pellucida]
MHLKELINDTERGINKINYSEFESFETISETGFCHVVKSEWRGYKLEVVLKKSHSDIIFQEIRILRSIGFHPHINAFYGVSEGITGFEDSGNLGNFVNFSRYGGLRLFTPFENGYKQLVLVDIWLNLNIIL